MRPEWGQRHSDGAEGRGDWRDIWEAKEPVKLRRMRQASGLAKWHR